MINHYFKNLLNKFKDIFLIDKNMSTLKKNIDSELYKFTFDIDQVKNELEELKIKYTAVEKDYLQFTSDLDENNLKNHYTIEFNLIKDLWVAGLDKLVIDNGRRFFFSNNAWQHFYHGFWCIFMSSLLNENHHQEFRDVYKKYVLYKKDLNEFYKFLNICNFLDLSKNNISLKKLNVYIDNNRAKYINLIKNAKSIAIIGNSPNLISQNKGSLINSFDLVIRFNNFRTEGFEKDYGSKTDIWIRGSGTNNIEDKNLSQFKMTVWEADYNHFEIHYNHLDLMIADYLNNNNYTYFDFKSHQTLRQSSLINYTSTGLQTIWDIYSIRKSFDNIKIFAFSTAEINSNVNYLDHYFSKNKHENILFPHNFLQEQDFLVNFLKLNEYNF